MKVEFDASEFVPPVVTGEWEQVQPGLFRAKDQDGKFVHMLKEALKKFDCIEDPLTTHLRLLKDSDGTKIGALWKRVDTIE